MIVDSGAPFVAVADGPPATPVADGGPPITLVADGAPPICLVDDNGGPYINAISGLQALYDPSDLTSIYQSRTGGSTGAVDSVVGIMLDKSEMGGKTAAAFIAGQSDLAPALTESGTVGYQEFTGGKYTLRRDASGSGGWRLTLTANKWYRITGTAYPDGPGAQHGIDIRVIAEGLPYYILTITQQTSFDILLCTGSDARIDFSNPDAGWSWAFNNLVVQEIPGYHALAPSNAARPILRTGPYIDFDGVDDVLNAVIGANLGSSCSVYHRTQAGAHVWVDGATINAGDYAMSTTDWRKAAIFSSLPSAAEKAIVEAWGAT